MSTERVSSHGRGGAGNIKKDDPNATQLTDADLATPTIKGEHYTTGRGGTGNMARNLPEFPEIARAAQDVGPPSHREPEGPHHYGRGGAANVINPSEEEKRAAQEANRRKSEEARREEGAPGKGLVDKGRDFLSKLGKK